MKEGCVLCVEEEVGWVWEDGTGAMSAKELGLFTLKRKDGMKRKIWRSVKQ